ncbi:MAG: T9SS type A sorting domain-containing protein [Saprospiraceae bacterium]|nr:T9SS type A sorting domain-containing protein [Saprospiraceae bacterium]
MGNSVYDFTDENPINGTNYYRLKQMDFDDHFEYSNVIILTSQFIDNQQLTLFPNPVRNELNLANVSQGNIIIYNSLGQIVRQISVNDSQTMINVSDLENGIYTLKLQKTDGTLISKQFVKL